MSAAEGERGPESRTTDPVPSYPGAGAGAQTEQFGMPVGHNYVVLERIGAGAMGTVYRGASRDGSGDVAIKILKSELAADERFVSRFVQERTILLRLGGRGVVAVRDMVVERDVLAIVMDLVPGGSLRSYLDARGGKLSEAAAAGIVGQIFGGLANAHALGCIHRDVKPENILVDDRSEPPVVKLTDFGISGLAESSSVTHLTSVIGTPIYMAPDLSDPAPATAAVDVYAAAVVLYELVAGKPPFSGGHAMAVLRRHLEDAPPRPAEMSDRLWQFTERLLAKDPLARPDAATAGTWLDDFADKAETVVAANPAVAATLDAPEASTLIRPPAGTPSAQAVPPSDGDEDEPTTFVSPVAQEPEEEDLDHATVLGATGEELPAPPPARAPRARTPRGRVLVIVAGALVLLLVGVGALVGILTRQGSYQVETNAAGHVVVMQGGSFLWIQPTVAADLGLAQGYLGASEVARHGPFGSLSDAKRYLLGLHDAYTAKASADAKASAAVVEAVADLNKANAAYWSMWPCPENGSCSASDSTLAADLQSTVIPPTQAASAAVAGVSSSIGVVSTALTAFHQCLSNTITFEQTFESYATDGGSTFFKTDANVANAMNNSCSSAYGDLAAAAVSSAAPGWTGDPPEPDFEAQ